MLTACHASSWKCKQLQTGCKQRATWVNRPMRHRSGLQCTVARAASIDELVDAPEVADDLRAVQEQAEAQFEV